MPHWIGSGEGHDPQWQLILHPHEWETYTIIIVSLLTCGCREGRGHRVMGNPTGASLSVSVWDLGRECLERRGVI